MAVTVPTKQYDGGSNSVSSASFSVAAASSPEPKVDMFAKYSSNLVRLKTLLFLGDNEGDEDNLDYLGSLNDVLRNASISDHAAWARNNEGNNSHPITQQRVLERKTRISFELHPSLLLYDLIDFDDSALTPGDDENTSEEREG